MQFISYSEIYGRVSSLGLEKEERWKGREWKGRRVETSVDGIELLWTW